MEESKLMLDNCSKGNESSSNNKPPNPLAGDRRLEASATKKSLVRHPSLVRTKLSDVPLEPRATTDDDATEYLPILCSGAWADIGSRSTMEDVYVCTDNFMSHYKSTSSNEGIYAFYGIFDGHGGKHAANFACNHLPRFIAEDEDFSRQIDKAISFAFLQTDSAFAEASPWMLILLPVPLLWQPLLLEVRWLWQMQEIVELYFVVVVKLLRCREITNLIVLEKKSALKLLEDMCMMAT